MSDTAARRLATIVALDVAGYSARTEADEARTTAEVAALRHVIEGIAKARGGRVFNTAGDGFMLEFGSSLSAVEAAAELAEECRPRVRIGVHVGDVVVQPNGDLLGHGVNVAARLMARSEPGAFLVSGTARQTMRGPLADRLVSRGIIQLDKMAESIEVFAVGEPASLRPAPPGTTMRKADARLTPRRAAMIALPVLAVVAVLLVFGQGGTTQTSAPDTGKTAASIAVLPFENLSADKDNAFFAVGIQDEILTRLSKIGALKVISRTSTAKYASHPDNLKDIAKTLGVSTILEGSVQRSGDKVRVNVQLIRAETDDHLWAEIYDRRMQDIFAVQTEISTAIAQALNAKLSGDEQQVLAVKPTGNVEAYEAYLRASKLYRESVNFLGELKAEPLLRKAVALDPDFAQAWALLAVVQAQMHYVSSQSMAALQGNPTALDAAARKSLAMAERLQPDMLETLYAKAYVVYRVDLDYVAARRLFEELSVRWPGNAEVQAMLGFIARRQGRLAESIRYLSQLVALDPLSKAKRNDLAYVLSLTRHLPEALGVIDEAIALEPGDPDLHVSRIRLLQSMGRVDEAARDIANLGRADSVEALDVIHNQALLTRDFASPIAMMEAKLRNLPTANTDPRLRLYLHVMLGEMLKFSGREAESRKHFVYSRDATAATLRQQPNNRDALFGNAYSNAFLGDRKLARASIDRAIELYPITKDYLSAISLEQSSALTWLLLGDKERALPELDRLMSRDAGEITFSDLRRLPYFDLLRGDPRFEALLKRDPALK